MKTFIQERDPLLPFRFTFPFDPYFQNFNWSNSIVNLNGRRSRSKKCITIFSSVGQVLDPVLIPNSQADVPVFVPRPFVAPVNIPSVNPFLPHTHEDGSTHAAHDPIIVPPQVPVVVPQAPVVSESVPKTEFDLFGNPLNYRLVKGSEYNKQE